MPAWIVGGERESINEGYYRVPKQDLIVEKTADDSAQKPEKKKGRILGIFPKP